MPSAEAIEHERARCERELLEKKPAWILDEYRAEWIDAVYHGYVVCFVPPDARRELTYRSVLMDTGLSLSQVLAYRDTILDNMTDAERITYFDDMAFEEARYKPVWDKKARKKTKEVSADPLSSIASTVEDAKPKRGGRRKSVSKNQGNLF